MHGVETKLEAVNRRVSRLIDLLATEGEERNQMVEVYKSAYSELQAVALEVKQLHDEYNYKDNPKLGSGVSLLAANCFRFSAKQVSALNMALDAFTLASIAEGKDFEYVQQVIWACEAVFTEHHKMVMSTLVANTPSLIAMTQLYESDPGGPSAAFDSLLETFPAGEGPDHGRSA
jgi:hypothetical protein